MSRKSWIQIDGKLIPKEEYYGDNRRNRKMDGIMPDIEPFKSIIDGSIIGSRSTMRAHFKEHDVTPLADFSPEYRQKKQAERLQRLYGQTKQDKQERIELLKHAVERHERRR